MKKTILVPTDFCIESLKVLKIALNEQGEQKFKIILMSAQTLTDSISELLFYSPSTIIKSLKTAEFDEALDIIRNRFEHNIIEIKIKLFHGKNQNAFANFLEANQIDEILVAKNYKLQLRKNAFNPMPFINKSKLPLTEITWQATTHTTHKNQIDSLFY